MSSHEHHSMMVYTRPGSTEELHRCPCGAAGSKRPDHPVAWFYGGTYHDAPTSRIAWVLDRAMRRELDELSPTRISRDRTVICGAVVTEILQTPAGIPLRKRVVEVNRAIARTFHSLLTHEDMSVRTTAKQYAALLRNGRDVDQFDDLLRRTLATAARDDLLEAYDEPLGV